MLTAITLFLKTLNPKVLLYFAITAILMFGAYKAYSYAYNNGSDDRGAKDDKKYALVITTLQKQIETDRDLYNQSILDASKQQSEWMSKYQKAIQDDQVTQTQLKAAAAVATASNDSLRKSLSVANAKLSSIAASDPAQSTAAQYATTIDTLLDECVSEYRQMAQNADGHAADVAKLDAAWPTKSPP